MNMIDLARMHIGKIAFLSQSRHGNFIGGKRVEPFAGKYLPIIDPATDILVSHAADSSAEDVDMAVTNACLAFEDASWAKLRPADREHLLCKLATLIEQNLDELSAIDTLESGKLQWIARNIEVGGGAEFVRYMAGWATKLEGQTLQHSIPASPDAGFFTYTTREPVGVVAAIVPWNFPFAIALWKIAPALAAGCTVVLKPAEETPLSALRLAELAMEAGFPAGVLNVVCGRGETVGAALCSHPGISKLSFTGSTSVGKTIGHKAVDNMTRFTLELGGKSPLIILEDADPDQAAAGAAMGVFFNQGQVCTAGSRVFVQRKLYERVVDGMAAFAEAMVTGSGFDPASQLGPLVSRRHCESVMGYINRAKLEGAKAVTGGERALNSGNFIQPTVFVNTKPDHQIVREEVFGPVVVVTPFDSVQEAVHMANNTAFGLAASVWSQNLSQVHRIIPQLQAGIVWVNCHNILDNNLPFGGVKQSGYGRDMGRAAVESYTEIKSVCMAF